MNKQIYTITELSKELDQPRQNVRRRLIKLGIEAVNMDDRKYKTDPLEYDHQTLIKLAEDFGVVLKSSDSNTKEQASTTEEQAENDMIKVLKEQLEHERAQNKELSKANNSLLDQLDKNQMLLNQQQQLTMMSKGEVEQLKIELKSKNEEQENNHRRWWHFFRN